jgi:hypothetical protein
MTKCLGAKKSVPSLTTLLISFLHCRDSEASNHSPWNVHPSGALLLLTLHNNDENFSTFNYNHFNYLLTPWSRVLLEKLTSLQLVKKFTAFYRPRMFITAFTSARNLSLSWASLIQPVPPYPTSWRSILILSSHLSLGLPNGLSF